MWIRWVWGAFLIGILSAGAFEIEGAAAQDFQQVQSLLNIPAALARVTDASWPDPESFPDYFLIQDVHRHPQVQNQIAALVEQGYEQWGVKKVFLEGAFTVLDLSVFHRVPKKTQSLLLDRLIAEGSLSGPELAAVHIMEWEWRNPPVSPFQIFGLEDPGFIGRIHGLSLRRRKP